MILLNCETNSRCPSLDPPDSIPVGEFMRSEIYGRYPLAKSRNPFTCGLTGKTFTPAESHRRSDLVARALANIMGWEPNADLPWDKVVAVFSFNTVSPALFEFHCPLYAGKGGLTILTDTSTDRLPPHTACHSPSVRHCVAGQCRILGQRAGTPAQVLGSKGIVHLRPRPRHSAGGGKGRRDTRGQDLHYGPPTPLQEARQLQDPRRSDCSGPVGAGAGAADVDKGTGGSATCIPVLLERYLGLACESLLTAKVPYTTSIATC